MSRESVKSEMWEVAFGVDHVTGTFVQVYKLSQMDIPIMVYDAHSGLSPGENYRDLPPRCKELLNNWDVSYMEGYPNLTEEAVMELFNTLLIPINDDLRRRIFELWD